VGFVAVVKLSAAAFELLMIKHRSNTARDPVDASLIGFSTTISAKSKARLGARLCNV